jgi:hypothetical protein
LFANGALQTSRFSAVGTHRRSPATTDARAPLCPSSRSPTPFSLQSMSLSRTLLWQIAGAYLNGHAVPRLSRAAIANPVCNLRSDEHHRDYAGHRYNPDVSWPYRRCRRLPGLKTPVYRSLEKRSWIVRHYSIGQYVCGSLSILIGCSA